MAEPKKITNPAEFLALQLAYEAVRQDLCQMYRDHAIEVDSLLISAIVERDGDITLYQAGELAEYILAGTNDTSFEDWINGLSFVTAWLLWLKIPVAKRGRSPFKEE